MFSIISTAIIESTGHILSIFHLLEQLILYGGAVLNNNTKLKDYFPMLRTREEILENIKSKTMLMETYNQWSDYEREEFLDFCTGAKGIKMTYDTFFKEIFNPELAPERLSDFLSEILGQKVKILHVLPNDTTRIAEENALLITDIVVELEDGSIANVEIQKIGYLFVGERAACYSADLLLRQYKRLRAQKKKNFTYKDIKPVYVIVLFEASPKGFHEYTKEYIHHLKAQSDTEIRINLLQEFYFISLDIFNEKMHNDGVTTRLEAWLTFLCTDSPEDIVWLITNYPEFKGLYEDVYRLCMNIEKVMGMFSEELRMLDVNTTQLMIDMMQEDLERAQENLEKVQENLEKTQAEKEKVQAEMEKLQALLSKEQIELQETLSEKDALIKELQEQIKKAQN